MKEYEQAKLRRICMGMSTEDLAKFVGTTKQTISNYELGKKVSKPVETLILFHLGLLILEPAYFDADETTKKMYEIFSDGEFKISLSNARKMKEILDSE